MTIEQLIEELQQYDPKMEVQTEIFQTLHRITTVKEMKVKEVKDQRKKKGYCCHQMKVSVTTKLR